MYEKGDIVNTCQAVSKQGKEILVANKIRPGHKGIVVKEETFVTINFDGVLVILKDTDIEFTASANPFNEEDATVDRLMGMFGMKK